MQETLLVRQEPINASITVPGSKSITNRALLLAALADGQTTLEAALFSDDTITFAKALQSLGVDVQALPEAQRFIIQGCSGNFPNKDAQVWCQDAGTATRFLLAACANSPGQYHFDGSERMRERPIVTLLDVLRQQGCDADPNNATNMPFTIKSSTALAGGKIFVPGKKSSQFLSALLMIAPYAQQAMQLTTSELVSQPYIKLTCQMMQEFGISVTQQDANYIVNSGQQYQARDYLIEPDLSTASYFFASAALTQGEIIVKNIDRQHCKQGDVQFLNVLETMGCVVTQIADTIKVSGPDVLEAVDVDMGDFSDTFMTLATMAPFANGPTMIRNLAHTRLQESDRVAAVASNLTRLGIQIETGEDFIKIYPGIPKAGTIDSHNDHRIAMSFALIGLKVPGIVIDGAECVAKTCPNYFDLIKDL